MSDQEGERSVCSRESARTAWLIVSGFSEQWWRCLVCEWWNMWNWPDIQNRHWIWYRRHFTGVLFRLKDRPVLEKPFIKLISPGGRLECKGFFTTGIVHKNQSHKVNIYVATSPHVNNLLGGSEAIRMGLHEVVNGYDDVFGDIWLMKSAPVKIKLRQDAVPYSMTTSRCIPFPNWRRWRPSCNVFWRWEKQRNC